MTCWECDECGHQNRGPWVEKATAEVPTGRKLQAGENIVILTRDLPNGETEIRVDHMDEKKRAGHRLLKTRL